MEEEIMKSIGDGQPPSATEEKILHEPCYFHDAYNSEIYDGAAQLDFPGPVTANPEAYIGSASINELQLM